MSHSASFEPGTLWTSIIARTRSALTVGALKPIATEGFTLPDDGVNFQVRVVSSLVRRKQDGKMGREEATHTGKRENPFLPYDKDLFVADISETHICLLNKYPVIDHHVLIITRHFESQESYLSLSDFQALWKCQSEYRGLCFYNSGPNAGASQPHKHLQLVPLPLAPDADIPISPLLQSASEEPARTALPFPHGFARLNSAKLANAADAARHMFDTYLALLDFTGVTAAGQASDPRPYNLLATTDFMLVIPRARHGYGSVYVNALGVAGSFFVSERSTLDAIKAIGPMRLLQQVAAPGN